MTNLLTIMAVAVGTIFAQFGLADDEVSYRLECGKGAYPSGHFVIEKRSESVRLFVEFGGAVYDYHSFLKSLGVPYQDQSFAINVLSKNSDQLNAVAGEPIVEFNIPIEQTFVLRNAESGQQFMFKSSVLEFVTERAIIERPASSGQKITARLTIYGKNKSSLGLSFNSGDCKVSGPIY